MFCSIFVCRLFVFRTGPFGTFAPRYSELDIAHRSFKVAVAAERHGAAYEVENVVETVYLVDVDVVVRCYFEIRTESLVEVFHVWNERAGVEPAVVERDAAVGTCAAQEAVGGVLTSFYVERNTHHGFFHNLGVAVVGEAHAMSLHVFGHALVVELYRIFGNDDVHIVEAAAFPEVLTLFWQQQTVADEVYRSLWKIAARDVHELLHLRMEQRFAAEQLYFSYSVACAHELSHASAVGLEHLNLGICLRRERREIVASAAVQVAVVNQMEVQYWYEVLALHVLACPLCYEREQFASHEHQSVRHHSFNCVRDVHIM